MEGRIRSIRVLYEGMMSYSDLAPVLDELNKEFRSVRVNVIGTAAIWPSDQEKAGAGLGVDLQFLIDVSDVIEVGAALIMKDFLSELAKDGYKSLRGAIINLRDGKRKRMGYSDSVSFSIVVGAIRFDFDEPLTDDDFVCRLKAARVFADSLPESSLLKQWGGSYFSWDDSSKTWRGPFSPGHGPENH